MKLLSSQLLFGKKAPNYPIAVFLGAVEIAFYDSTMLNRVFLTLKFLFEANENLKREHFN